MKRVKQDTTINASSMADIAFLLLIFFLVTTTIDFDKGIQHTLPQIVDDHTTIKSPAHNTLTVLVNSNNQLLVNGEPAEIDELRETVKTFIDNWGQNPKYSDNPNDAIVSLQNDKGTSYGTYLQVQNELKGAYRELRDAYAQKHFGQTYGQLKESKSANVRAVKDAYPMRLSEAEPFAENH